MVVYEQAKHSMSANDETHKLDSWTTVRGVSYSRRK